MAALPGHSVMHRPQGHRPLAYYKPKCPIDLAGPGQFDLLKFGDVGPSPIAISPLKFLKAKSKKQYNRIEPKSKPTYLHLFVFVFCF